ncbi:RHS repeat-associated core domain-containing protein [Promicromonospora soli]
MRTPLDQVWLGRQDRLGAVQGLDLLGRGRDAVQRFCCRFSGETAFYGYNAHTDVETLTDQTGNTVATYGYTAYGNADESELTGIDAPNPANPADAEPYNAYRYNSKRWDASSGTYDMGFRDYNPGLNRFTTRDMYNGALADIGLGSDVYTGNRYAFTAGNPISFLESDGHEPREIHADAQGGPYEAPTDGFLSGLASFFEGLFTAQGEVAVTNAEAQATLGEDIVDGVVGEKSEYGGYCGGILPHPAVPAQFAACDQQDMDNYVEIVGSASSEGEAKELADDYKFLLAPWHAELAGDVALGGGIRRVGYGVLRRSAIDAATGPDLRAIAAVVRGSGIHAAARNNRTIAIGVNADGRLFAGSSNGFDAGQRAALERWGITRVPGSGKPHAERVLRARPDLASIIHMVGSPA